MIHHEIRCSNRHCVTPGVVIGTVTLPADASDVVVAMDADGYMCGPCWDRWWALPSDRRAYTVPRLA